MQLTLAKPDDHARVLGLYTFALNELGVPLNPKSLDAGLSACLRSEVQAALYMIGPSNAPVGVLAVSFGFDMPSNGLVAHVDMIYIREAVRRRGLASWAISTLMGVLKSHGVSELRVSIGDDQPIMVKVARSAGLRSRALGVGYSAKLLS